MTICEQSSCTGCGVCYIKCPKKCITFTTKKNLGHIYPQINEEDCINCGKCKTVCPSIKEKPFVNPEHAYAGWSKNENEYRSSTSGGAATVFSRHIIKMGGVVYGCEMLPNIVVKHIRIENLEDVKLLKGSKYVQSSIVEVLPLIEKDINNGRLTLFIGTPCQCAAVRALFKTKPTNLILIDLICHGVPSIKFLRQCVYKKAKYPNYDNISFRLGNEYCMTITSQNRIVYQQSMSHPRFKDLYLNSFYDGFSLRECCYSCQYAQSKRISDITIGDFWGLGKMESCKGMAPHPNGCSLIIPLTSKGHDLLNVVKPFMNIYPRNISEAISGNEKLRHPTKKTLRIRLYRTILHYLNIPQIYYIFMIDRILKLFIKHLKWKCLK